MNTQSWDKARVNWDSAHILLLQVQRLESKRNRVDMAALAAHATREAEDLLVSWRAHENTSDWIVCMLWEDHIIPLVLDQMIELGEIPANCPREDWIATFRATLLAGITADEMKDLLLNWWPR